MRSDSPWKVPVSKKSLSGSSRESRAKSFSSREKLIAPMAKSPLDLFANPLPDPAPGATLALRGGTGLEAIRRGVNDFARHEAGVRPSQPAGFRIGLVEMGSHHVVESRQILGNLMRMGLRLIKR